MDDLEFYRFAVAVYIALASIFLLIVAQYENHRRNKQLLDANKGLGQQNKDLIEMVEQMAARLKRHQDRDAQALVAQAERELAALPKKAVQ